MKLSLSPEGEKQRLSVFGNSFMNKIFGTVEKSKRGAEKRT
jgi:hypothetical protein